MNQGPRISLVQVDAALARWDERLRQIDENVLELEGEPICIQLQGAALEGQTNDRVLPALTALDAIFRYRAQLGEMLDRVRTLRAGLSGWRPNERALREIEDLLFGPSMRLVPVQTPLAKRGLLTSAETEQAIPPEALLARMTDDFASARDALMATQRVWEQLTPAVDAAEHEIATLAAMADDLGAEAERDLAAARLQIESARLKITRDPLGADGGITANLAPMLRELRARLGALGGERADVEMGRKRARDLLRQLRDAHAECDDLYRRAQAEIVDGPTLAPPLNAATLDGLAGWLATLERTMQGGRWKAAGVGFSRWIASASADLARERASAAINHAPLAARDELRGRLRAREQQAQSLVLRGMPPDPALDRHAREAGMLLDHRPTPLRQAATLVGIYEEQLNALLGRRGER